MQRESEFRRFHQILFWPVELHCQGGYDIDRIAGLFLQSSNWTLLDPLDRGTTGDEGLRYAEYVYFHPFAQRFLYSGDQDPEHRRSLRILRRNGIHGARIELSGLSEGSSVELSVARIHLYIFQPRVAMLVVEAAGEGLSRETLLQFQDQFRRAYAPYFYEGGSGPVGGNCPSSVVWLDKEGVPIGEPSTYADRAAAVALTGNALSRRPSISRHWLWLLQPMRPIGDPEPAPLRFTLLEDDRMASMCFVEHENPHRLTRSDLVRLCFYDGTGEWRAYPYAEEFLSSFEKVNTYRRFWQPGSDWLKTIYLGCGYGFVAVTAAGGTWPDTLLSHFRHHYFQLGLIAHFHRAALLRFSRRFTEVTLQALEMNDVVYRDLTAVRQEFAGFMNSQWFHEVSNQDQGRELFDFWSTQLGNARLMIDLSTEAAAVDRMLSSHRAEQDREGDIARNATLEELSRKSTDLAQKSTDLAAENKLLTERVDKLTVLIYWLAGLTFAVALGDTEVVRHLLGPGGPWASAIFLGLAFLLLLAVQVAVVSKRRR